MLKTIEYIELGDSERTDEEILELLLANINNKSFRDLKGETKELVIVLERNGTIEYLLDLDEHGNPKKFSIEDEKTELAKKAINAEKIETKTDIKDHHGSEVYSVYQNLEIGESYTLGIIVKVDKSEVLRTVIITGSAIVVALIVVAAVFGRLFQKSFVSVHKKVYKERERALEANKSKTEFLARMSHELRTPMNAIVGLSDLVLSRNQDEATTKYLKIISDSSKNLLEIINDILDYSKIEIKKLNVYQNQFDLKNMLTNVYELMSVSAKSKNVHFNMKINENIDYDIITDEARLTQILINLISNAIKFTDEGKKVEITVDIEETKNDNATLTFEIKDEGIGMEHNAVEKIFEPFHQADDKIGRKYGGTGLGLAITKALIEMLEGHLELYSVIDEGTTVKVVLPIKITTEKIKKIEEIKITENIKVLIVDDMFPNRLLLKEVLEIKGINVVEAENGSKAIDIITQQENIDIILMDIQMPGLNGYETTQEIRKLNTQIPIIAVSADALKEHIDEAKKVGMNDYVTKPINFDELIQKINNHVKDKT